MGRYSSYLSLWCNACNACCKLRGQPLISNDGLPGIAVIKVMKLWAVTLIHDFWGHFSHNLEVGPKISPFKYLAAKFPRARLDRVSLSSPRLSGENERMNRPTELGSNLQDTAKRWSSGCVNAAGKARQKWWARAVTKFTKPGERF